MSVPSSHELVVEASIPRALGRGSASVWEVSVRVVRRRMVWSCIVGGVAIAGGWGGMVSWLLKEVNVSLMMEMVEVESVGEEAEDRNIYIQSKGFREGRICDSILI